jgi:16S rRNA (cytosine967-C5)-methyltransferase
MSAQELKSARTLALEVLNQFDKVASSEHTYVSAILNPLLGQTNEKQRTTDLVFGTIRNRFAIDTIIVKLTDCSPERIPKKIHNIIRIGAYELIYCPTTAQYAIVDKATESASKIAGQKQVGFVNAILREITRHIADRQMPLSQADAEKILPQTVDTGCKFDCQILPDPRAAPVDYFSAAFSVPKWLITNWLNEYGLEKTRQICFASNRRPSVYIRPNPLKTTFEQLAELFRDADIEFEITPDKSMIKIKSPHAITELPGFSDGLFTIQDPSAAQPVKLLNPQPEWKILDLCAAPGTKTMQLAELTADKARIFATDISCARLKRVRENISRLGVKSVTIIDHENISGAAPFDAMLLDVPCSNTGVLSKRPEVRYRIKPQSLKAIAKIQMELLQSTASLLKPKGKICYSTCSIQRDENDLFVKDFLATNPDFKVQTELLTLPATDDFDCDGAYAAIIIRST